MLRTSGLANGINGYVSKRRTYTARKPNRGKYRQKLRFQHRVEKAIENSLVEQQQLIQNSTQRIATGANSQSYGAIVIGLSKLDLTNIFTQIGTTVQGTPALTGKAMRYTVNSQQISICMKNQVQGSTIVDLYELLPRTDTASTAAGLFGTGMTDQNSTNTDIAWGTSLFDCNAVCSMYKIVNVQRYLLAPGAIELIEIRKSKPVTIEYERILGVSASNGNVYRGISTVYLAIIRGEPTNDATTKTNVGTLQTAVDFVVNEKYRYSYSLNNMTQTSYNNGFQTVTTPDSILIDTGAVINPTNA